MTEKEKALEVLRTLKEAGYTREDLIEAINLADGVSQMRTEDKPKAKKSLQVRIKEIFKQMGMPAHIYGYRYAEYATKLVYEDPSYLRCITTRLYPDVAKEMSTTPSRVERAIRHAVETACNNPAGIEFIYEVFGNTIYYEKGKPMNKQFLAMLVEYLKMEDEEE